MLNEALGFGLMPATFARLDIHNIEENQYEDIFFGTSRGFAGISPQQVESVTGRKTTSLCLGSVFPLDDFYLLQYACKKGKPKRFIYELDPSYYTVEDYQGINNPFLYNEMALSKIKVEYYLDKYMEDDLRLFFFPWLFYRNGYREVKDTVKMKLSKPYQNYDSIVASDQTAEYMPEGFQYHHRREEPLKKDGTYLSWCKEAVKKDREEDLERIIQYCKDEKIELLVITLPAPKETIEGHPEGYENAHQYYSKLFKEKKINYLDFNMIEDRRIDNQDDNYWDSEGHMYGDAAERFSKVLGAYLLKEK